MEIKKFILDLLFPFLLVLLVGLSLYHSMIFNRNLLQFQFVLVGGTVAILYALRQFLNRRIGIVVVFIILLLNFLIYGFDVIGIVYSILLMVFIYFYFQFMMRFLYRRKAKILRYITFGIILCIAVVIKGIVIYFSVKIKPAVILSNLKIETLYIFIIGFVSALGFDISELFEKRYIKG